MDQIALPMIRVELWGTLKRAPVDSVILPLDFQTCACACHCISYARGTRKLGTGNCHCALFLSESVLSPLS